MDPNFKKAIEDFKIKNNTELAIDCVDLEKCLREFKTELYIKRNEVSQLRTELDKSNLELQNVKKALDLTKKALDENQFNVSFQLKRARKNEEELQEKRESLMKIQLQHKMVIAEVNSLKQNLQRTETEKTELSRKVDVFEAKQRHNSLYHNEIVKRDNQLRNLIGNINEMVVKLRAEQNTAIELSKNTQLANETLEKLKICAIENEKLRNDKERFEEMYISVNAKYEKLEKLMATNSCVDQPNLLTKIIFNQWKLNMSYYETDMKGKNEMLNKITEFLTNERTTNIKLIEENENFKNINNKSEQEILKLKTMDGEKSEIIKVLNEKIKLLQKSDAIKENGDLTNSEHSEIQVKEETIEIVD